MLETIEQFNYIKFPVATAITRNSALKIISTNLIPLFLMLLMFLGLLVLLLLILLFLLLLFLFLGVRFLDRKKFQLHNVCNTEKQMNTKTFSLSSLPNTFFHMGKYITYGTS
jgi:hypothetical protein